jgi:hypothetical protein
MIVSIALDKLYLIPVAIWLTVITIHGIDLHTFGKVWRADFKSWLKTYKNKPQVRIVAENIESRHNQNEPVIFTRGRVDIYVSVGKIKAIGDL